MGARVEMQQFLRETTSERSHPEWVCGLKCRYRSVTIVVRVSHLLGARVEIRFYLMKMSVVAPHVGVWVET